MTRTEPDPAVDEDLLPSSADVDTYESQGWYLSRKLLTDAEVATLNRASEEFYAGRRDGRLPETATPIADWTAERGDIQRNNDYIHVLNDEIRRVLTKPVIGAVAARLARTPSTRIFQATLLHKPPSPGEPTNVVPWHYDKYYWATCRSDSMLTAFIPFHDCGEDMGTLTMVPGSHRWPDRSELPVRHDGGDEAALLRQDLLDRAARANAAAVTEVPVTIPAGHMTFHHCLLYHGSRHNRSDRPRRAISLHLQDEDNRYQPAAATPLARQGAYKHDELVRATADGLPDYTDPYYCPQVWPTAR